MHRGGLEVGQHKRVNVFLFVCAPPAHMHPHTGVLELLWGH